MIFFNFRPDRAREMTRAFCDEAFTGFDRGPRPAVLFTCFVDYDETIENKQVAFHKEEIRKLIGYTTLKGLTIVPLSMYINEEGRAKLEIAVARGKKNYDKRDDMAKKDAARKIDQAMKHKW